MEAKRLSQIACVVVVLGAWAVTGCDSWNKTLGGPRDDVAYSVVQAGDGGYIVAGSTDSHGASGNDVWLLKTDADSSEIPSKY